MWLPRLYAIADAATCSRHGVSVGAFARELREGGVRLVQYRDKRGSPQEVLAGAAELTAAFAGTDSMLVMNDRADLAVLAGWRGVHVGHRDLPVEAVRRVLAEGAFPQGLEPPSSPALYGTTEAVPLTRPEMLPGMTSFVGISTHDEEQVRAADAGEADYIAIGPVFATGSKADTEPVVGLEGVRRARALTRKPLVAIGGITRANARAVIEAGADSVAVIGGLFAEGESVAEVARDFLRILL